MTGTPQRGYCRQQGYDARTNDAAISDCPYSYSTREAAKWRAGWRDRDFEIDGDTLVIKPPRGETPPERTREYGKGRTITITVALTGEERAKIEALAERAKKNITAFVRERCLTDATLESH